LFPLPCSCYAKNKEKGDVMVQKGVVFLLLLASWFFGLQAGSVDRFVIKLAWKSVLHAVKDYPLVTGSLLAIVFRKQLYNLFFERRHKSLVSLVGEHPFIGFSLGIGAIALMVDATTMVPTNVSNRKHNLTNQRLQCIL
jgi:hypothetical protein